MATNMLDQVTDEQERLDLMHAYEELNLKDAQRLFTSLTERVSREDK